MKKLPTINPKRLLQRIQQMGKTGALPGGGVCRLALSNEDKASRDLFTQWCQDIGLRVLVDPVGNMMAIKEGKKPDLPLLLTGSHLDTVATGGLYDGALGVLAGLEVIETLQENDFEFTRSIGVANFTNEEGARFTPDMMGSLYLKKGIDQSAVYQAKSLQTPQITFEEEIGRIGYQGSDNLRDRPIHRFIELHIEQGPVLEQANTTIGVVEMVQGIYWTEFTLTGTANHAGTTPMHLRHDAGYVAAQIATYVRQLTQQIAGQVATVGRMSFMPDIINVVPQKVVFTVDLRNTDEALLQQAQQQLLEKSQTLAQKEGVALETKSLVRFAPVTFDSSLVRLIESTAQELKYSTRRMPSGAGHDAQMMAAICPTSMIFVPSVRGISHNINEFTQAEHIEAGCHVLLGVMAKLSG